MRRRRRTQPTIGQNYLILITTYSAKGKISLFDELHAQLSTTVPEEAQFLKWAAVPLSVLKAGDGPFRCRHKTRSEKIPFSDCVRAFIHEIRTGNIWEDFQWPGLSSKRAEHAVTKNKFEND